MTRPGLVGTVIDDRDDDRWWWRRAEVAALSAFAFTQPLYSLFGQHPTFLVAHDLSGLRLVVFTLTLAVLPASLVVAIDHVVGLAPAKTARWFRLLLRGALFGFVVGPPVMRAAALDGLPALAVIGSAGTLGGLLFVRVDAARRALQLAVFGIPLFMLWFLFLSPASGLLTNGDADAVDVHVGQRTSVVWVVFDQIPLAMLLDDDGEIDAERFPAFARLAASSTWFPRATTISSSTNLAMTSTLSGRFAEFSGLPVASQVPVNLFTLLASTHRIHAYETVTQLCPHSICGTDLLAKPETDNSVSDTWAVLVRTLLPDAVADGIVPEINDRWDGFGAEGLNEVVLDGTGEATTRQELVAARAIGDDRERFEAFIDGLEASNTPGLHYLHMEKPHEPLMFVPDGRIYDTCSCFAVDADGRWPEAPEMSRQRVQRYLLQTMHVDRLLGRVLDRLEETGLADESMLVVMSDHGASMLPGASNRALTPDNVDEVLPIPLFVRYPGKNVAEVDNRVAQPTDLLPAIVELLQLDVGDEAFDGRSLLSDPMPNDASELITPDGVVRLDREPDATASEYIDWLVSLFPDPANPWAQGPAAALVGTVPRSVGASRLTASLENLTAFDDVDLTRGYVPAHLIGELHGADDGIELAVAANGTIAGVGTTFWNKRWRISLMLDPDYLADGANAVELYEVTDAGLLGIETR